MPIHVPLNPPLPDGFPQRPRRQLRDEALQPISLHSGTNYPCSESKLRDATTPNHQPVRPVISKDQASYNVQAYNVLGGRIRDNEYSAICRLEDAILGVFAGRHWTPDLIIKAFCDLDLVFFLGHLRGNVYVQWRDARSFPRRRRNRLTMGRTDYLGGGKAVIKLNADAIFAETAMSAFKEMWRTLLHEMCHAYEFTQVASNVWQNSDRHGRHFGTKIRAVHDRAIREIHVGALHRGEIYHNIVYERRR